MKSILIAGCLTLACLTGCSFEDGMSASDSEIAATEQASVGWQYIWRHTGSSRMYLDVQGGGSENGTPVWTWEFNGSPAQMWYHYPENGALVNASGKCLDVQWGGTAAGTPVWLWECNGTEAQQWVHVWGGAFQNPQSRLCLDVPGDATEPAQLQLWDCNGTNAQAWEVTTF